MARELPRVWIRVGKELKEFYQDNRLLQFRNVNNPHEFYDFDQVTSAEDGELALLSGRGRHMPEGPRPSPRVPKRETVLAGLRYGLGIVRVLDSLPPEQLRLRVRDLAETIQDALLFVELVRD